MKTVLKWRMTQLPESADMKDFAKQLTNRIPFPLPLTNLLFQKGITTYSGARGFFAPQKTDFADPHLLRDMDRAVQRIADAMLKGEKILLYGDYDVDGTTSVALLWLFFRDWGQDFPYYVPDRYSEGYGLSYAGVDFAVEQNCKLIVVMDCGTKEYEKVKYARQKGLEVIICDHHNPGSQNPDAQAFINPRRKDCSYPFKELSACGICLRMCEALEERFKSLKYKQINGLTESVFDRYCDLVTLSVACDLVPLVEENRVIAMYGLEKIRKNPLPGIAAMKALSGTERAWDITDLVFFIGPMINSAGRLEHAKGAVEVLLGQSAHLPEIAAELKVSNEERKNLDKKITAEALEIIEKDNLFSTKNSTVLYRSDWHKGVIGIVASRVIEHYFRPTVLLTRSSDDLWTGSGRSVPGFDLHEALEACSASLVQFGGHKYAAGLTLKTEQLEAFTHLFEQAVASRITPEMKAPVLEIGGELDFSYLNMHFVSVLSRFAPFGPGNPEPVFLTRSVEIREARILGEEHVKFSLLKNGVAFDAIGFWMADAWKETHSDHLDVAYHVSTNTWNGKTAIQLRLKDFRKAEVNS